MISYVVVQSASQGIPQLRAFWDVAPCNHVEVGRRFRSEYSFHHQGHDRPDDEGGLSTAACGLLYCLRMKANVTEWASEIS
jgi:hypothetical protein